MITVTGATGLLGSHILYQLCQSGEKVRALHRKNSNLQGVKKVFSYYSTSVDALLEKIEWVEADLLDITDCEKAFAGTTKLYHCAAVVSFDARDSGALEKNAQITANVVNTALYLGVEKMLYVSSVAALGRAKNKQHINENTEWVNGEHNSKYARSKYRAELEVWRGIQEGLNTVIINPTIILGPGDWSKGSAGFFKTIATGFKWYTTGVNGYTDVRDVSSVAIQLMQSDVCNERFVVVGENLSYQQFFTLIADAMEVKAPYKKVSIPLAELIWRLEKVRSFITGKRPLVTKETAHTARHEYYYDATKIKERIGFEFTPIAETVQDLARFYKEVSNK